MLLKLICHLIKAVWIYNKEVLSNVAGAHELLSCLKGRLLCVTGHACSAMGTRTGTWHSLGEGSVCVTQALPQSHQLARKYCQCKLSITLKLILSA